MRKQKVQTVLFIEFLSIAAANHLLMMMKGLGEGSSLTCIVVGQKNSYLIREAKKLGIQTYEMEYKELIVSNPFTYIPFLRMLYVIAKIIAEHNVDVIHCHRLQWAYIGIIASKITGIPLVVHIVIIQRLISKFQNFLIRISPDIRYLAVSQSAALQFMKLYEVDPNHIHVHYGGIFFPDVRNFQKKKITRLENIHKKYKYIIGMVSRMDPLKGVDVFIEAASLLQKKYPSAYFIHIGMHKHIIFNDTYQKECLERVKNLNLQSRFLFLPYTEDILGYYKYFYCTVLPTYKDTLSYVNLESMSNKVPVVFTDIDGVSETVKAPVNLSIPYPPSPVLLAHKVSQLISDKKQYVKIQERVYAYTYKKFDSSKNAKELVLYYSELSK